MASPSSQHDHRHTHYRYKPPTRKRKAAALDVSEVVTAKGGSRPVLEKVAAAEVSQAPRHGRAMQPSTPPTATRVAPPANNDRKPAIVTVQRPGKRFADVPNMTPEEQAARQCCRRVVARTGAPTGKDRP
jgi:hypothetical protein